MDWTRAVDGYCERVDPSFWAEPINAVTNLGFIFVALWLWPRMIGLRLARLMCGVLFLIGLGSFLFHTFAQPWAGVADVLPILGFILLYIYASNRDYFGWSRGWAVLGTLGFFPFAAMTVPVFQLVPGLGDSAGYAPVPVIIAIYAVILRGKAPETAVGLTIGAGLLTASILLRSMDEPLCSLLPMGTHFLWHLCNAAMLGWMIWVYRRHLLAGARRQG